MYKQILRDYPPVPDADQVRMLTSGIKAERDRVLLGYSRTIIKLAKKYTRNVADLEDVFQQAYLGLSHAANLFDPNKKVNGKSVKPITYFTWWIREKVLKYAQENRLIQLPNLPWKLLNDYYKQYNILHDHTQAVDALFLTPKRKELLSRALHKITSISCRPKGSETENEIILDSGEDIFKDVLKKEYYKKISEKINTLLTEEEKQLLELRRDGLSRREVGEILEMTQSEVTRREKGIKRLCQL